MDPPKVLLIGYSGANNTGAEALLQADIEDLRAVFGDDALLTVPAVKDPANLRRYLHEGPSLRIVPMPSIFLSATRRLVREHDLVVLVEGSAYMDTWTSALLWYFLWATRCAAPRRQAVPRVRGGRRTASTSQPTARPPVGEHDRSHRHPLRGGRRAPARVRRHRADRVDRRQRVQLRAPSQRTRNGPGSGHRTDGRPWASRRSTSTAGRS